MVKINLGGAVGVDVNVLAPLLPKTPKHGDKYTYQKPNDTNKFLFVYSAKIDEWGLFNVGMPFENNFYKIKDSKRKAGSWNVVQFLTNHPKYFLDRDPSGQMRFATTWQTQDGVGSCAGASGLNQLLALQIKQIIDDVKPRKRFQYLSLPAFYATGRTEFVKPIANADGVYEDGSILKNNLLGAYYYGVAPLEANGGGDSTQLQKKWGVDGVPDNVKKMRTTFLSEIQKIDSFDGLISALNEYYFVSYVGKFAFGTRDRNGIIDNSIFTTIPDKNGKPKGFGHAMDIVGYTDKVIPGKCHLAIMDNNRMNYDNRNFHPDFSSGRIGLLDADKFNKLIDFKRNEMYVVKGLN